MMPKQNQDFWIPNFPPMDNNEPFEVMSAQIKMLTDDNARLKAAGAELAIAALRVATEYDGVHRLLLAVSVWAKAMADENGRGDATGT